MDAMQKQYKAYLFKLLFSPVEVMIDYEALSFEEFCQKHLESTFTKK